MQACSFLRPISISIREFLKISSIVPFISQEIPLIVTCGINQYRRPRAATNTFFILKAGELYSSQ
jgi:hypothetical protein